MYNYFSEMLHDQETSEYFAYQSSSLIISLIQKDFANGTEVLQAVNQYQEELPSVFQRPSLVPMSQYFPIPVRTSRFFRVSKHTCYQVPYLHSHNFFELIYVLYGKCEQYLEEPYRTADLERYQSCLLKPGIRHVMGRSSKKDLILKFSIPVELYQEVIAPVLGVYSGKDIITFDCYNAQIEWCIYMLIKESSRQGEFYKTAVKKYLSLLFIELMRKPDAPYEDLRLKLYAHFEENLGNTNLHKFAAELGYSDAYAGRLIKNHTGKNFMELVIELKVAKAAKLLAETDYSVAAIANLLGYVNPSGLYKQFYRTYGMTPKEYRNLMIKKQV